MELSSFDFWLVDRDTREATFRALRDTPGLRFSREMVLENSPFPPGPGYWSLVRYEDVWAASRNPELFCSGQGSNIADLPQELNEFYGSMINMDDPKHHRLRSLVSKGFTPKEVAASRSTSPPKPPASSTACSRPIPTGGATSSRPSRHPYPWRSSAR
jgi:cytochrome P450